MLHAVLRVAGLVFYSLSWVLFLLLLRAVFTRHYTFFGQTDQDLVAVLLLAGVLLLQTTLYVAMLRHRLHVLAVPIALVCWVALFLTVRAVHRLPEGQDDRWEHVGQKLFPPPRR